MATVHPLGARPPLIPGGEQPRPIVPPNPIRPLAPGDPANPSGLPPPHPPVRLPPPGPSPLFPLQAAMPPPAPQAAGNPPRPQFPPPGLPTTHPGVDMPPRPFMRLLPPSAHPGGPPLLPPPQQAREEAGTGGGGIGVGGGGVRGGGVGSGEVWYEHKLSDGRVYYSHSQTQKTTWDRPQNVEIIPHPGQQGPSSSPSPTHVPSVVPGMPPPFPMPLPRVAGAPQLVPTRVWTEYNTPEGKPYYYNKVTRVSVWEKPKDFELIMPLPAELGTPIIAPQRQSQPQLAASAAAATSAGTAVPQHSLPPPTQSPSLRPPLIAMPPGGTTGLPLSPPTLPLPTFPTPVAAAQGGGGGGGGTETKDISAEVEGGEEKMAEVNEGKEEEEEGKKEGEEEKREGVGDTDPTTQSVNAQDSSTVPTQPTTGTLPPSTITPSTTAPSTTAPPTPPTSTTITTPPTLPIITPQLKGASEEGALEKTGMAQSIFATPYPIPEPAPVKEELKGPRPISSIPVPGTPWSVVWTTDDRTFFFDATSRVSLWIMPEELEENPHAARIIENGPVGNKRVGELKSGEPSSKRPRLDEDEGEGEEEMEVGGGGLDTVPEAPVVELKPHLSEAAETERKSAMIRAGKTPEERQAEFKEMLLERGVSAFSTWEKELPKFVFDPRYMLLSARERKNCFEEFIRSRAEEERREKRSKLKAKRDEFRKLLEDAKLHPKSNFSEFALRYGRDERFKVVEKMREREQLFSDYLQELKKAGKQKGEGSTHSSTPKSRPDKTRSDFMDMLHEDHSLSEASQWKKVKGSFERDPRYRAVPGSSQREEWFKEHIKSLGSKVDPSREREERIQASIKEREREVKMSRTAQEKEWGRERDQLRKTEAVQHFKALLVDMVRSADAAWHDTRKQLKQDHRWSLAELLESSERERIFQEHVEGLMEKKRLQFRRLLEETSQITLVMPWKKARKLIKDDPRYKNYGDTDHRREAEYDKYLRDKMVAAKNEFRGLLRETKLITYKSHGLIKESEKHYKEIAEVLKNDQRYLVLECVSEERELILQDYIHDMYQKGPPPPPTATNPSERLRKP